MFRLSVAQYPTIPVRSGTNARTNSPVVWNALGWLRIGPSPPACRYMNTSSDNESTAISGAEKLCRNRMDSTPL